MSDDRKYELPPFVQNDDSATMIAHFAARRRRAYAAVLASTSPSEVFEPFPPRVEAATASLLLQAVIVPGARTGEGRLIEAVIEPWFESSRFFKKTQISLFNFRQQSGRK
jgi:hypothetical protein